MKKDSVAGEFLRYIASREQRTSLVVFAVLSLVIWCVMRVLYPMPFLFPDSGSYVQSAVDGMFNVYRPMGYSGYISFVHGISSGIGALFNVSFLLSTLAVLWFLYSVKFLWGLRSGWLFYVLGIACIAAPRVVFAANFIMSDGLFNTLTLLFLTSAMWIVRRRSTVMIVVNVLLLVALYKVRYVGMFYVVFSLLAMLFSVDRPRGWAWAWLGLPVVAVVWLSMSTASEYERHTGTRDQGFAGWQLINNASVLIPRAAEIPSSEFTGDKKFLHELLTQCPDTLFTTGKVLTTDLMWSNNLPYKQLLLYSLQSSPQPYPIAWVRFGNLYGDYARDLIMRYPGRYFTDFVVPSFMSNFSRRDIFESTAFESEPLYDSYFTGLEQHAEQNPNIFAPLNVVRYVVGSVMWVVLLLSLVFFCATIRRGKLSDPAWRTACLLILFIVIYIGLLSAASPNTTWRYTLPIYMPSIAFIAYNIRELATILRSLRPKPR